MTVQTNTNVASFNGNGVTQIFPVSFKFNRDTDLVVLLVDDATGSVSRLTLNSDYTVSGEGDEEGGLINVVVAPATGKRLKVTRVVDILQLTDLRNQGKFFAEVHEDAFDLLTMIAQQHESGIKSALRVADSDPEPARIPAVAQRAGKILSFDSEGNPVAVAPISDSSTELRVELAGEHGAAMIGYAGGTVADALTELARGTGQVIHASEFGLTGDGSDETAKVQAAVTAAATQGKTLIGDRTKTYRITSQINGASNCHIEDLYLDASALTGTKHALVFAGALGDSSLLTANAPVNSFSVSVANGAMFAVDEWVLLTINTAYYPFPTYNVAKGEWVQIRSISGNVLTFTTPTIEWYTVTNGGAVRKCNFAENIRLKNVRVNGSAVPNSNERGICFRFARFFEVDGCVLENLDQYALELDSCIKFSVHHCRFRGTFYNGTTGLIFYAITLVDACQYFTVHDNQGSRARHLVVTTAFSAGMGRWGQAMFGVIHDNIAEDCMAGGAGRSYAYEVHGTGRHLLWANNIANGCYAFMRIEGGSDIQVLGGGCNGYAYQGLIIGGEGQTLQRVKVSEICLSNYTAEVTDGLPAAIRIEASALLSDISLDNISVSHAAKSNIGTAVSCGGAARNLRVSNLHASTGEVESTAAAVSTSSQASGYAFQNCNLFGWQSGYAINGSKTVIQGGRVENFVAGAAGWGFYSNGAKNICKDVHFSNINTSARLDVSSSSNLVINNTITDCLVASPNNSGASNTISPNYIV
ncbi:hypothetical protein KXR63_00465 [Stutzerimonas chloritidismutans]|uniref:hypothetical protein n=1 Tax=Stutzerimonas chloritidismutans TaxID=203192 RepID=UPI003F190975